MTEAGLPPGYERVVHHLDGDPRNNDLANLEVREVKDGSDEH